MRSETTEAEMWASDAVVRAAISGLQAAGIEAEAVATWPRPGEAYIAVTANGIPMTVTVSLSE